MSKKKTLAELAMEATTANIVKGRSGSGKTTYLDRVVKALLDEDGKPVAPKTRVELVAEISLEIAVEQNKNFSFENEDDVAAFAVINNKVKNQVAAAVSNSNNSTALSYNENYKDVWAVVKSGGKVSLIEKGLEEAEGAEQD